MSYRSASLAIFAFVAAALHAAENPRFSGAPVVQFFTERQIPSGAQTRSVLVHPEGLIYVASADGLSEFDGETWRLIPGTRGIPIHNIMITPGGRLWYSASDQFGWLEADAAGALKAKPLHQQLPPEHRAVGHVLRMVVMGEEAFFLTQGPRGGLVRVDAAGEVHLVASPAGERPVSLFARDGGVQVLTGSGAYSIENDILRPALAAAALTKMTVFSVWPREAGGAWVVAADGLYLWRAAAVERVSTAVSTALEGDRISSGCPLGDGTFALGTENHGVLIVDPAAGRILTRYDRTHGLGTTGNNVTAVTTDASGGLWISRFDGVVRVQAVTPAARHDGLEVGGRVQAFATHRQRLYVATTQGVAVRDPASGRFTALHGFEGDTWALLPTADGLIVGGLDLRLLRDDGTVEIIEPERLLFRSILRLRREPDRLLASTGPGRVRLYRRTAGQWRFEAELPNILASLYPLIEDADGRIWATRNRIELVRIDWREGVRLEARLEPVGVERGMPVVPGSGVRMHIFELGDAIEVSSPTGLWRHDRASDRMVPESRIAGFDAARWSRVHPLRDGSLWLANARESEPSAVARPAGPDAWKIEPIAYTGLEAIRPLEIYAEPETDTVWIGHLGLASFDRSWRGERAPAPVARLRAISTSGAKPWWSGAGAIPTAPFTAAENPLMFTFAAPAFQPDAFGEVANEYRTRLDGFERDWSAWNRSNARRYSNLPPGRFGLRVQARDRAGREGPQFTYAFTVLPPWWLTWWFKAFLSAAGVAAIVFTTRWASQRLLRRQVALLEARSAVERERLRLARDLHDEVGSGLGRVILFAEEAERESGDRAQLASSLRRVRTAAKDLAVHAREIVWAVSPQYDTLASVVERIGDYVDETLRAAGISVRLTLPAPGEIPDLAFGGSEARHGLFLAIKEAVHNCVKYSGATTAEFTIAIVRNRKTDTDELRLTLRDHGRGFASGARAGGSGGGHGLKNIADRAEALGGRATILSASGMGTTLELVIPLSANPRL